jgi:hypothetical protein
MAEDQDRGIEVPCHVVFADDGSLILTCKPVKAAPENAPAGASEASAEPEG